MTTPIGPVQPINPVVTPTAVIQPGIELNPSIMGGPYNPAHGNYTWDDPVPWAIQQGLDLSGQGPTVEASLLGDVPGTPMAGQDPLSYADPTSTLSHAAPWPYQRIPDAGAVNNRTATALQAAANAELHSYDDGTVDSFTTNLQVPGHKMPWTNSPQYHSQGAPSGIDNGQLDANGMTGRDRFAGLTAPGDNLNRFGFDQAHVMRPNPAGDVPVPLNTTQGHQRPMVMNVPGRYQYPTGSASPFSGQVAGVGNNVGAAEIGVPSDYTPPPDAPTNPQMSQQGAAGVMIGTEDIWLWPTHQPLTWPATRSRKTPRWRSAPLASAW
jgi:hypothetical protein